MTDPVMAPTQAQIDEQLAAIEEFCLGMVRGMLKQNVGFKEMIIVFLSATAMAAREGGLHQFALTEAQALVLGMQACIDGAAANAH